MINYKEIIIVSDNKYINTKGLNSFIEKEIRLEIGNYDPAEYVEVIKYMIDYIADSKPIISENQNISYYSMTEENTFV
ncbi:hypothetical protein [Chryseobacterium lathyri]|uniref:hypothetical protein n=1 Tax=Chryseobacterium lathyri TaxID=395933 RepID=UPI001CBDDC4C|nr:hypothetical protein [Chryseobacterium lathyri]